MYERTELLLGAERVEKLRSAHVLLFGLGGVGSYVAEALARAGVGALTLVDDDTVSESNLNRQLVALHSTQGKHKTQVAAERIADINPECRVTAVPMFYMPETADQLPFAGPGIHYDYVIDAVDTVTAKLEILQRAQAAGVPAISCMGTGGKLHPELLRLSTLEKTEGCPLARVMRRECRARGLKNVQVVWSPEPARPARALAEPPAGMPGRTGNPKKTVPGSVSFVPGAAGLILAGAVIRAIAGIED